MSTVCITPEASQSTGNQHRLQSIDMWRGFAVLAVIAIHFPHYAHGGIREHPFFIWSLLMDYGYLGVHMFILISGFCIHRNTALSIQREGMYKINWLSFWKRRFWRLYPPYLIAIALSIMVSKLKEHDITLSWGLFWGDLISHLLMIHNLFQEFAVSLGNGVFWSLGLEEQLYALYAVLLVGISRKQYLLNIMLIAALTISWRLLSIIYFPETIVVGSVHLGRWYMWPFHYWFHWALGALAVDALSGNTKLPAWCYSFKFAVVSITAGMLMNSVFTGFIAKTFFSHYFNFVNYKIVLGCMSSMGEVVIAVGFFLLINWSLKREIELDWPRWVTSLICPIGKISYSVYLTHIPVQSLLIEYIPFGNGSVDWLLRAVIYIPIMLGVSFTFYFMVEKWFLRSPIFHNSVYQAAHSTS